MQEGIYAKFNTSKGEILVKLTYDKTPGTVGNFVALAEGNQENKVKAKGEPYYDGLTFHRVIPDFMIQGGCPKAQEPVMPVINSMMNSILNSHMKGQEYSPWRMLDRVQMVVNFS